MRRLLLAICLTLSSYTLMAQDSLKLMSVSEFFAGFKNREIDAEGIIKPTFSFGVSSINVVDNRYDTLHLGSIFQAHGRNLWLTFQKKSSLSKVLTNNLLQKSDRQIALFIVVKDFWFTESIDTKPSNLRKNDIGVNNNLVCKIEFYQKTDNGFIAITKIDTSLASANDNDTYDEMNRDLISKVLQISVDKINRNLNNANYIKRREIRQADISESIIAKFDLPILHDTVLRKGVYKTKEEFINNAPSEINYNFKQDKKKVISLYIKDEKGNEYLTRESWGFCDGKNIFINDKGMFNSLFKIDNAFYWVALRSFRGSSSLNGYLIPVNTFELFKGSGFFTLPGGGASELALSHILYLLNLDTGIHY